MIFLSLENPTMQRHCYKLLNKKIAQFSVHIYIFINSSQEISLQQNLQPNTGWFTLMVY